MQIASCVTVKRPILGRVIWLGIGRDGDSALNGSKRNLHDRDWTENNRKSEKLLYHNLIPFDDIKYNSMIY